MALTPSGALSLGNVNTELGLSSIVQISLGATGVRTLYQVASGAIRLAQDGYGKSNIVVAPTYKAIYAFGRSVSPGARRSTINYVSSAGVMAADTPGVGTARSQLGAAGYGGDKAIFGFGSLGPFSTAITNLVSNTGVVAADTPGVGSPRSTYVAAAGYGTDKAIFGNGSAVVGAGFFTNLVSNTGVVASNTPGVGTIRVGCGAARYGSGKAIFGYGQDDFTPLNTTQLVSDTGVMATDTPGVGTARQALAAAGYGGDKAIFGFGVSMTPYFLTSITNLVSNTGVVASDTPGVGTARDSVVAANYGGDKAMFAFGYNGSTPAASAYVSTINLVSNTGVVASNTPGTATLIRYDQAAAGYSATA